MSDLLSQKNGGFNAYPDRTQTKTFFRSTERFTKTVTVASGQVLKAYSFLESKSTGKVVAHRGLTEAAQVTFTALTAGQVLTLGGLTYTDGGAGTTGAELAAAWAGIADGGAGVDPSTGTFSNALAGWSTEAVNSTTVVFNSSVTNTNPADLAASGNGAGAATIVTSQGSTSFPEIAGVLCFDVDASIADTKASAFTKASFWADALVWGVDISVDTIPLADGTTKAVTAYDTGCSGTSETSNLFKQKFVDGSDFKELGFLSTGETA